MTLGPIGIGQIHAARERITGSVMRTPLVRLDAESPAEIYLKLENLQPIGSFKLRGAGNAIGVASGHQLRDGVVTASAGNMAQGVAWIAKRLGLECTVIVPDHAPDAKLAAIGRYGGRIDKVSYDRWWQIIETHRSGHQGLFIHPVCDAAIIAGNGTIGLEVLDDLPDIDAIVIPYGGGGLSSGIATAIRAVKPDTRIYACEIETAAPLKAALDAGEPTEISYQPSFVDGIGSKSVLAEMWPLVSPLIDDSLVVSLRDTAAAIRLLIERHRVVAEGAGAASVAAALAGLAVGARWFVSFPVGISTPPSSRPFWPGACPRDPT